MANKSKAVAGSGTGISTLIVAALAILKLAGVSPFARWSWVLVLAPWWGGLLLGVIAVIAMLVIAAIAEQGRGR